MAEGLYSSVLSILPREASESRTLQVTWNRHGSAWHISGCRAKLWAAWASLGLLALVAICMQTGGSKSRPNIPTSVQNLQHDALQQDSVGDAVQVFQHIIAGVDSAEDFASDFDKLMSRLNKTSMKVKEKGVSVVRHMEKSVRNYEEMEKALQHVSDADQQKLMETLCKLGLNSTYDLTPANESGCNNEEDYYVGLCFKSCALLTGGKAPKRASPFLCCKEAGTCLGYWNESRMEYAQGSRASGTGWARKPARCFQAEEMVGGLCYMRCELLTLGKLPYRTSSTACCKKQSLLAMLEGFCVVNKSFAVGAKYTPTLHPPLPPSRSNRSSVTRPLCVQPNSAPDDSGAGRRCLLSILMVSWCISPLVFFGCSWAWSWTRR